MSFVKLGVFFSWHWRTLGILLKFMSRITNQFFFLGNSKVDVIFPLTNCRHFPSGFSEIVNLRTNQQADEMEAEGTKKRLMQHANANHDSVCSLCSLKNSNTERFATCFFDEGSSK